MALDLPAVAAVSQQLTELFEQHCEELQLLAFHSPLTARPDQRALRSFTQPDVQAAPEGRLDGKRSLRQPVRVGQAQCRRLARRGRKERDRPLGSERV